MYENVQFEIAIFIHFKTAIDNSMVPSFPGGPKIKYVGLNDFRLNYFLIMPSLFLPKF